MSERQKRREKKNIWEKVIVGRDAAAFAGGYCEELAAVPHHNLRADLPVSQEVTIDARRITSSLRLRLYVFG